jgi:hypothetical protein
VNPDAMVRISRELLAVYIVQDWPGYTTLLLNIIFVFMPSTPSAAGTKHGLR